MPDKMRNYLSFGGGVNSVALHLLMLDEGIDFESVFVHHGTDWPETYQYVAGFQWWLKQNGHKPITILRPKYINLYDYCLEKQMVPVIYPRWCTRLFKREVVQKYVKTPCFMHIGIDFGEAKRARVGFEKGIENRYLLIENEINRNGCKNIIKRHSLSVPIKSGCFICPYQSIQQWKTLRRKHLDLFCKAETLENRNIEYRLLKGKKRMTLSPKKMTLRKLIEENQGVLFKQDEYPPCNCGL
jgi:hypothetical protein